MTDLLAESKHLSLEETVWPSEKTHLVSLGTKGNYKEGKEISLAIDLVCKLSCS